MIRLSWISFHQVPSIAFLRTGFSFSAISLERFCFDSFHFVFCLFSVTLIIPSLSFPIRVFFLLFFLRHRADFSFYSRNLLPKIRPNGEKRGEGVTRNFLSRTNALQSICFLIYRLFSKTFPESQFFYLASK
jgi:hypothetical protein